MPAHPQRETVKIGSFCSGVGALDLAVERVTGGQVVWHSETDKAASLVLEKRWAGVPNHGDLRFFDWSTAEPVDAVCAGFPCQPISQAGKGKGRADSRWLWDDIVRAISRMAARPRWAFLENVPRLLTIGDGLLLAKVIHDLAHLGFVGRYGVLPASAVGAPHLRKRWFLVAHARGEGWEGGQGFEEPGDEGLRRHPERPAVGLGRFQPAVDRWATILGRSAPPGLDGDGRLNPRFSEWVMGLPEGWVTDLLRTREDKLRCIGNSVVPQQAEAAYRMLLTDAPSP